MARKPVIPTAILDLMRRPERHAWTIEDLRAGLAAGGIAADFSSVFRGAERLVAEGTAKKLVLDDGRARFELMGAHHDHLHCLVCDEVIAIPCLIAGGAQAALEAEIGVAISEHQVILSGRCPTCAAAA